MILKIHHVTLVFYFISHVVNFLVSALIEKIAKPIITPKIPRLNGCCKSFGHWQSFFYLHSFLQNLLNRSKFWIATRPDRHDSPSHHLVSPVISLKLLLNKFEVSNSRPPRTAEVQNRVSNTIPTLPRIEILAKKVFDEMRLNYRFTNNGRPKKLFWTENNLIGVIFFWY